MRTLKMFFLTSVFMCCCLANSNTQESTVAAVLAVQHETHTQHYQHSKGITNTKI